MPINSLGQYSAGHKVWDHVGNILPDIEHSEGERPAVEWRPAAWLPVQFFDKYYEDFQVVMPGKLVACDSDGRLCPAQYGLGGATITYTQDDVNAKVTDVTTGLPCDASSISNSPIDVSDVDGSTYDFMGRDGVAMSVGSPLGVAPYAYLRWAGGDGFNPADLIEHNYIRQHQVAVLCDYVIQLPLVPAAQSAAASTFQAPTSGVSSNVGDELANLPVAANTSRTPIVFTGTDAGLFTNQVASLALVLSLGDWHINLETGLITIYSGGTTPSVSVAYYHYASAPAAVSKFASAIGDLKPGDFVKCDANSNFVVADGSTDGWDVMGQVLDRDSGFPKDALERVRTAFAPSLATSGAGALPGSLGQLDQMPGSANGGMPANIAYAGAADTIVRINLISR